MGWPPFMQSKQGKANVYKIRLVHYYQVFSLPINLDSAGLAPSLQPLQHIIGCSVPGE
jgi:hypothetical protein